MNNINTKSGYIESFNESSLDLDEYEYSEKDIKTKSNIFAIMHKYNLCDKSSIQKNIYQKSKRINYNMIQCKSHDQITMQLKTRRGLF